MTNDQIEELVQKAQDYLAARKSWIAASKQAQQEVLSGWRERMWSTYGTGFAMDVDRRTIQLNNGHDFNPYGYIDEFEKFTEALVTLWEGRDK